MTFDPQRSWRHAIRHYDTGNFALARNLLSELHNIKPDHPPLLHLLGMCEFRLGNREAGIRLLRQATALAPQLVPALSDLGIALTRIGETAAALAAYEQALAILPGYQGAAINLAHLHAALGDFAAARGRLNAALEHVADPGPIRWTRGLIALSYGEFQEGWSDYAVRWSLPSTLFDSQRNDLGLPPLRAGDAPPRDPVWVWREQGIGDEILFASTISDALAQGWQIHFGCSQRCLALFRRSFPALQIYPIEATARTDIPKCRSQLPLGDLAARMRSGSGAFGSGAPFLQAEPLLRERLRERYRRQSAGRPLVGVSWRSANRFSAEAKSPPLAVLEPLLQRDDCAFVDLQYGDTAADLEYLRRGSDALLIHDSAIDPLGDIDVFAAQIASLDAVVTVSNTTAHIAGALGIPTIVLLPMQDGLMWYWFRAGAGSRWYASLSLVRQNRIGEWSEPVAAAAAGLDRLLRGATG